MSFKIITTEPFEREFKRLFKKYRSLKKDIDPLLKELTENPTNGIPIGKSCYILRMAIRAKGKGKSGGARIITLVRVVNESVYLLDIYDKSEKEDISEKELAKLILEANQK